LDSTKLFSINIRVKESLGNIVVKDIKSTPLLRPRLLKLKVSNRNPFKDRKACLNATTTLSIYILIIKTKGIKPYIASLIISF